MKRNPGEWLRDRLRDQLMGVAQLTFWGTGWLCGGGLALWLTVVAPANSVGIGWLALMPGVGFLLAAMFKTKRGWRLPDMKKGASAEEKIGQAIEYALTRDSCAVAHHVKGIARVGDIDHLVATPKGLWVIETKYRRVPRPEFAETLRRIASNVEGVRQWSPGTRVIGCLVFANEPKTRLKPTYEQLGETIKAFANRTDLMRELRNEARGKSSNLDLARRVWKLGRLEPGDRADTIK